MNMAILTRVLVRPIITERSTMLQEQHKYTFEVALTANKGLVKQAVETLFEVKVLKVNTIRIPGKTRRFGPRLVRSKDIKKAVVTLRPGDTITVFEGV
jgi:large subunit ribosomal protein L23